MPTFLLTLSLVTRLMQLGEVPGLSIVVIRGGRIAEHHAFGVANADTGAPLTERTIFESASLTKPVFAYAVLKLVDAGVLSLDVPLHHYLPEPVTDERMKLITARMVLSHTTGFQNEVMPGQTLEVQFTPGSRFSYSGAGFLYLQRVVEHRTGKPLPQLMRELVFVPLGMRDSGYVWLPGYETSKAYGHRPSGLVAVRRRPSTPTVATLHTTPLDYARFMLEIMKHGKRMMAPQVPVDAPALSWGLGWALETTARGTAFWHWGENNAEFQNFAMGYPDGDGIVVFTNSGNGFSIMPEVVAAALGGDHPAFKFMGYEHYDAPAKLVLREVRAGGTLPDGMVNTLTEKQINRIGYDLLERGRIAEAIRVFERNVERFPASGNVYDSLGEANAAAGDTTKAIANYEKALALDPKNGNAVEMLRKLRK